MHFRVNHMPKSVFYVKIIHMKFLYKSTIFPAKSSGVFGPLLKWHVDYSGKFAIKEVFSALSIKFKVIDSIEYNIEIAHMFLLRHSDDAIVV